MQPNQYTNLQSKDTPLCTQHSPSAEKNTSCLPFMANRFNIANQSMEATNLINIVASDTIIDQNIRIKIQNKNRKSLTISIQKPFLKGY